MLVLFLAFSVRSFPFLFEFQDKGKGEAVEKRKSPLSEGAGTAGKTQDADDRARGSAVAGICVITHADVC